MNKETALKLLAENLDDKIKFKGLLEMVDGIIIHKALQMGFAALEKKSPALAAEMIQLIEAYLSADINGMVDEAADCLAEIVKILFKI